MKKVRLLLALALASTSLSFAQMPEKLLSRSHNPSLREGEEISVTLPEGYTYADRELAKIGFCHGLGINKPGVHLAAAIELPLSEGVNIKGITFFNEATEKTCKVFLASRPASGQYGKYTIEQVKNAERTGLVTTVDFATVTKTSADKIYIVGYEAKAAEGEGLWPIGYVGQGETVPEGNLGGFNEDGSSMITEKGKEISFMDTSFRQLGNLGIVVHMDDPKGQLDYLAAFSTRADLPSLYKIGNSIPSSETKIRVPVTNWGNKVLNKIAFTIKKADGSTERKDFDVELASATTTEVECELGEITKKGRGMVEVTLTHVNDKPNALTVPQKITCKTNYALYAEGEAVLRNKFLIERFTTEPCANCPASDELLQDALKKASKKGFQTVIAAHHTGYEKDFLTLKESEELLPFFVAPAPPQDAFTPAYTFSRIGDGRIRKLDPVGYIKGIFMVPYSDDSIVRQFEVAHTIPSEAILSKIIQKNTGEEMRSITVTGKVLEASSRDDIYLSIYRTENDVPAQNQAGVPTGTSYKHQNAIRQFVTPTFGQKISVNDNGEFSITVEKVKVKADWENDKMHFIVFIHRNIKNKDAWMRYVYAAESIGVHTMSGTREVATELQPVAYAVDGQILIKGTFDNFLVYDITGRLVARDGNSMMLPAGLYVVKIRLGDVDYISKVVVK